MNMDNRPIGMFDSGVGGLTVYKEIRKKFSMKILCIWEIRRVFRMEVNLKKVL